jgi:acetoin utilization protein AcuB
MSMSPSSVPVRNYMSRSPLTIGPRQTLEEAHRLMRANRIRHLPVLDAGKLVGIVSHRDLMLIESLPDVSPAEVPVEDAMTTEVFAVTASTPLAKVVTEMADRRRGSAVVTSGAAVVGVFTMVDACRTLARVLDGHANRGLGRPSAPVAGAHRRPRGWTGAARSSPGRL